MAAALIYARLKGESAVLIDGALQKGLLAAFAEIAVFAVLSASKRFCFTKFLLLGAYAQLLITVLARKFANGYALSFGFAACGAVLVLINIFVLRLYKKAERDENNG
jgi:hypothetical protein